MILLTDSSKDWQSKPQEVKLVESEKIAIAGRESGVRIPRNENGLDNFQSQGAVHQQLHRDRVFRETKVVVVYVDAASQYRKVISEQGEGIY